MNPVKGSEQGGIRPVLIIQNDKGNKYSPTTIVAAITSKLDKHRLPTHVGIRVEGLPLNSLILLEQICTMDKSRLIEYVGIVDEKIMKRVDKVLIISVGINIITVEEDAVMTNQNNVSFYYSLNMLRTLLAMRLITEEEYKKIVEINAEYYGVKIGKK